ncbi:hypothetical protein [Brevundimonas vesicularis]|uniref:Uncharacterized protein n=1 Tax=Brevundimonas vesicularis TaxID=41276 RepID=A0A1Z3U8I6_BREVE|nr:hypothetical protein [Brevundimonas vesicularis]ASE39571.1 hypothetical protein CEP68_08660 [Brevundimonas vesicularis]MDX2335867.1 hypothetical protein [Brevundimonas vesicularis]
MTMDARILHARSGVTLEQKDDVYEVSSLRLSEPATFADEADAQRAFDDEVVASEQDPELMSRLGGA